MQVRLRQAKTLKCITHRRKFLLKVSRGAGGGGRGVAQTKKILHGRGLGILLEKISLQSSQIKVIYNFPNRISCPLPLTVPVGLSKIPTPPFSSTRYKVFMKSSWMSYGGKGNGKKISS